MSSPPELSAEVWALFDAACADALGPAEVERLETLLRDDEHLRDLYLDYFRLHAELFRAARLERARANIRAGVRGRGVESRESRVESESISGQWSVASGRAVESRESRVESEAEFPEIPKSLNPQIPALHSPPPLSTLHSWAFSYAVATLLLGIALLGAWFSTITHYDADALAKANSRRVTPSGRTDKETQQFTFVGKVSGMVDCQFADASTSTVAGAAVSLNRRYALKSGLMEIAYDSGAKVILQGPCDYTVESRNSGYLHVGKLVAKVESQESRVESKAEHSQSALTLALSQGERGPNFTSSRLSTLNSRLFAVRTPTALIEDLGTEFGVEVAENGETASHVFQGRVVMRTEGGRGKGEGREGDNSQSEIQNPTSEILLSAGQSARVEKDAAGQLFAARQTIDGRKQFVRRLSDVAANPTAAVSGDIFQDDFQGTAIDDGKWLATTTGGQVGVANGLAMIHSDVEAAEGMACLHTAGAIDFGKSPKEWRAQIRFCMNSPVQSGFSTARDWIILAGVSERFGNWEIQGFDLRAMQPAPGDNGTFNLGWRGWDNVDAARQPDVLARDLRPGRFYVVTLHRKPDDSVEIYLGGRLLAVKPLIAGRNPTLLQCGDLSKLVAGEQAIDYVKIGSAGGASNTGHENRKEESGMAK